MNKDIFKLNIDESTKQELINNKIENLYDLCGYSRMELNSIGLENNQINQILISVQLEGLDLKPNHAKKNNMLEQLLK